MSWIRRRDYHILTSGLHTYSRDERFGVVRSEDSDDWALQIRFLQKRDEGAYECQVSFKRSHSQTKGISIEVIDFLALMEACGIRSTLVSSAYFMFDIHCLFEIGDLV